MSGRGGGRGTHTPARGRGGGRCSASFAPLTRNTGSARQARAQAEERKQAYEEKIKEESSVTVALIHHSLFRSSIESCVDRIDPQRRHDERLIRSQFAERIRQLESVGELESVITEERHKEEAEVKERFVQGADQIGQVIEGHLLTEHMSLHAQAAFDVLTWIDSTPADEESIMTGQLNQIKMRFPDLVQQIDQANYDLSSDAGVSEVAIEARSNALEANHTFHLIQMIKSVEPGTSPNESSQGGGGGGIAALTTVASTGEGTSPFRDTPADDRTRCSVSLTLSQTVDIDTCMNEGRVTAIVESAADQSGLSVPFSPLHSQHGQTVLTVRFVSEADAKLAQSEATNRARVRRLKDELALVEVTHQLEKQTALMHLTEHIRASLEREAAIEAQGDEVIGDVLQSTGESSSIKPLANQVRRASSENADLSRRFNAAQEEHPRLVGHLLSAQSGCDQLNSLSREYESLNTEYEKGKSELEEQLTSAKIGKDLKSLLESEIAQLNVKLDGSINNSKEKKRIIKEIKQRNIELRHACLNKFNEKVHFLRTLTQEAESEKSRQLERRAELQDQLDRLKFEKENIIRQFETETSSESARLESEKSSREAELDSRRDQLARVEPVVESILAVESQIERREVDIESSEKFTVPIASEKQVDGYMATVTAGRMVRAEQDALETARLKKEKEKELRHEMERQAAGEKEKNKKEAKKKEKEKLRQQQEKQMEEERQAALVKKKKAEKEKMKAKKDDKEEEEEEVEKEEEGEESGVDMEDEECIPVVKAKAIKQPQRQRQQQHQQSSLNAAKSNRSAASIAATPKSVSIVSGSKRKPASTILVETASKRSRATLQKPKSKTKVSEPEDEDDGDGQEEKVMTSVRAMKPQQPKSAPSAPSASKPSSRSASSVSKSSHKRRLEQFTHKKKQEDNDEDEETEDPFSFS